MSVHLRPSLALRLTISGILYSTREVLSFYLLPTVWRLDDRLTDHSDVEPHPYKLCVQLRKKIIITSLSRQFLYRLLVVHNYHNYLSHHNVCAKSRGTQAQKQGKTKSLSNP